MQIYGAPDSPFSQPVNVIGGHIVSAAVGVACHQFVSTPYGPLFAVPLCAAASVMAMQLTRTLHPPAAATALIAIMGGPAIYNLGWTYVVTPCALAPTLLVGVGLVLNNVRKGVSYPRFWFK